MGVKGLRKFLEQCMTDACYTVYLSKLVHDYRMITGRNARIVVDAQSCYHLWYQDMARLLCCEVQELIVRLRSFVESFQNLNVELVFFFGGTSNPERKGRRSLTKYQKIIEHVHKTIDVLMTWGFLHHQQENFQHILSDPGLTTAYILKYVLGCEVHMTVTEYREEIIKYAWERNCFAILSRNTDFVISQVDAMVLSGRFFRLDDMTTRVYDRVLLAHRLGILVEELPLLAILAGNDLIQFDEIERFHRQILGHDDEEKCEILPQDLMPAIACYINQLPKNVDIEWTLAWLAVELSKGPYSLEKVLITSYYSYFLSPNPSDVPRLNENSNSANAADEWSRILLAARDRCWNTELPTLAYSVLSEQIFESYISFENLRCCPSKIARTRYQPSSTVLRPLRLRLYGVLLAEKNVENPSELVIVREWCNEDVNSYETPIVVQPIKPEVHHPGLMALWSDDDDLNEVRWTLFLKTISPTLDVAKWQTFDHELMLTTLSVYHLFEIKYLNEFELVAVLTTITGCSLDPERVPFIPYGKLDNRAIDIGVTLSRAFGLVLTILAVCGYPLKMSKDNAFLKFEDKIFQSKYADVMHRRLDIRTLCENNDDCFQLFDLLREMMGTQDDQSSTDLACEMGEVRI